MIAAVIVAQLADLVSFLAMPRYAELNPFALGLSWWAAIAAKAALLVLILSLAYVFGRQGRHQARERLLLFGALAGAFGAGGNASVLVAVGVI